MKKIFLLLISSVFFISLQAQTTPLQWAKGMGNTTDDGGMAVTVDAAGNVYTTGYFQGTVDFDPSPGAYTLTSVGYNDIFILKLDAAGNFIWAKSIGSPSNDDSRSIILDASNNIIVAGGFLGIADFDPGAGVFNLDPSGAHDSFLLKLDNQGNFIWAKNFGGLQGAYEVTLDPAGNIYVTGNYTGTVDFDPNAGVFTLSSSGLSDVFVLKLDVAGNFLWVKDFKSSIQIYSSGITLDNAGSIYTTGHFRGTTDFDPGPATFSITSAAYDDIFISKLDNQGNFIWVKVIGDMYGEFSNQIITDNLGYIYTTGTFAGSVDFDPNAGVFNLTSNGNYDAYALKLDTTGNFVWAKNIGGATTDMGGSIALDSANNVLLTGTFSDMADFDPNNGSVYLTAVPNTYDIFISQLSGSGNFMSAKMIGGLFHDAGASITADALGNTYVTGNFGGTVDFDPDAGIYNINGQSNLDIFVLKIKMCAINASLASQNVMCNGAGNGSATITASGGSTYTWSPMGGNSAIATGLNPNTYTCAITNGCNVVSTQTVLISQPSSLTLTALSTNTIVCAGNSATLTALASGGTGTISYTWFPGPTSSVAIVSPTANTIYSITIADLNNCQKSQTVSVNTNSLPVITVSGNQGLLCAGNTLTLTASGANTYSWSTGSTASVIAVSPTITTTYTLIGIDMNGCENSSLITQNVSLCTSTGVLNALNNKLLIYPNPFNDKIIIECEQPGSIEVYNTLGALVYKIDCREKKIELDLSHFSEGVYFFKINSEIKKIFKG